MPPHDRTQVDGDALLVLFSSERPSLDNSLAVLNHNAPRNIGFVKVPRDMSDTSVLSDGPTETGGFYNFGGGWSPQENKGVNWLTQFTSMEENASRLKATKLTNGEILILFEIWTGTEYVSSNMMTIDQDGEITRTPRASRLPFHMPFADEVKSTNSNTAVFFAGAEGKLVRYEVSLDPTTTMWTQNHFGMFGTGAPDRMFVLLFACSSLKYIDIVFPLIALFE